MGAWELIKPVENQGKSAVNQRWFGWVSDDTDNEQLRVGIGGRIIHLDNRKCKREVDLKS